MQPEDDEPPEGTVCHIELAVPPCITVGWGGGEAVEGIVEWGKWEARKLEESGLLINVVLG